MTALAQKLRATFGLLIKPSFFILGSLQQIFLPLSADSTNAPPFLSTNRPVVVLVVTLKNDPQFPMTEEFIKLRKSELQQQFPRSEVVEIIQDTNRGLREYPHRQEIEAAPKDAICIDSHGFSSYINPDNRQEFITDKPPERAEDRVTWARIAICSQITTNYYLMGDKAPFCVSLVHNEKFDQDIGWIFNNLSPNGKIIFTACNLLSPGINSDEKLQIAIRIAKHMKRSSGDIFLSEAQISETEKRERIEGKKGRWGLLSSVRNWFYTSEARKFDQGKGSSFVDVPPSRNKFAPEKVNQGYLLRIKNENGQITYELWRDEFRNTLTNRAPSGPLLAVWPKK